MGKKSKKNYKSSSELNIDEIERFILENGSDDISTFNGKYEGGCHCQQIYDEFAPLILSLLESGEKIEKYLEVGVAAGGTTFILNHYFNLKTIVLVDDNKHPKAKLRKEVLKDISVKEMIGQSEEQRILDAATDMGPFDFIFIDGDHRFEAVDRDTGNYVPMIRKNGFVALHDSALKDWGVHKVVSQLKKDNSFEFVGEYLTKTQTRACGVALFKKVL